MAHVILVSAQGPNPSFFLFIRLGSLLGPGFGPGLTIIFIRLVVDTSCHRSKSEFRYHDGRYSEGNDDDFDI